MSDNRAEKTPLLDLLRAVPREARTWFEHSSTGHTHIPYGRLCHEAADLLDALESQESRIRRLEALIYRLVDPGECAGDEVELVEEICKAQQAGEQDEQ